MNYTPINLLMNYLDRPIDELNLWKKSDFKCTMPLLCNSTRPQHALEMFADHCGPKQTIHWLMNYISDQPIDEVPLINLGNSSKYVDQLPLMNLLMN